MPRRSPRLSRARPPRARPARATSRSRLRRTLAIALLVGGVLLETAANLVQLAESHIVHDTLARISPSGLVASLSRTLDDLTGEPRGEDPGPRR